MVNFDCLCFSAALFVMPLPSPFFLSAVNSVTNPCGLLALTRLDALCAFAEGVPADGSRAGLIGWAREIGCKTMSCGLGAGAAWNGRVWLDVEIQLTVIVGVMGFGGYGRVEAGV